jgi:thiamine biosynthesis lipoprotein ApbE
MSRILFVLCLFLSGCAFTTGINTDVLPYKGSTLTITAENLQPSKAKNRAYKKAMKYCEEKGKNFSFVDSKGEAEQTFVLYFECK